VNQTFDTYAARGANGACTATARHESLLNLENAYVSGRCYAFGLHNQVIVSNT
jgi:hypothetical protein